MSGIETFIREQFNIRSESGDEVMAICTYHDDHNASMQINTESGMFICFSCGEKGGPHKLFRDRGFNYGEDYEYDIERIMQQINALDRVAQTAEERVWPEDTLAQYEFETDYWDSRNISQLAASVFELGYSPLEKAVTIPNRNMHGELLGVSKRPLAPVSDEDNRYQHPYKFHRKNHLFGAHLVEADAYATSVVLVEGQIDAMRVWDAGFYGMAVYGSSISPQQIRVLKRLGVLRVTLFFDNDAAGRKCTLLCKGQSISKRHGVKVTEYRPELDLRNHFQVDQAVWLGNEVSARDRNELAFDPGDLSDAQIQKMLQRTRKLV